MDFRHHLRRLFSSSARALRGARRATANRRRMFLESLESRQLLALLDDLTEFQDGDKGQPGDPLSKVGYDLANTYAYFQSNGTAPPATPSSNVSLMRFDNTRTKVLIDASSVAASPSGLEAQLQGLGFVETGEFGRLLSGWLPINQIDALAVLPELKVAHASYAPQLATGSVNSEGDLAMRANVARSTFNVTGAGVKVGILSDSFNALGGYATDIATGDLPPNVQILQDFTAPTASDEGRAMAQIVNDVAPGSSLAYATAFLGQASFASNIIALANAGSRVIVDDVFYVNEPFFQNGVISQAVNTVAARDVSFFSAAGNDGRQGYRDAFRSGTTFANGQIPSAAGATPFFGGVAHDFDPGGAVNSFQSFTLAPGAVVRICLQWDQPFGSLGGPGSANDVDMYVLDAAGAQVVGGSAFANTGGDPFELFVFQNTTAATQTFNFMIVSGTGAVPGLISYINTLNDMGSIEFATNSGTSFGHPNSSGAAAVGAANFQQTPQFGTNPPLLETFSSPGGIPILFADNGTRLATPLDLRKVDFVAPDGVSTTVPGFRPFFGTSAAAPHAAAVAALMKQSNPAATAPQLRSALASTALPMANPFTPSYNYAAGAGLIQADAAINALRPSVGPGVGKIAGTKFNDLDGDGVFDIDEDLDRDGALDPSEDVNGNGMLDLGEDLDGDGVLDLAEDLDGDGVIDPGEDLDNDGVLDPSEDLDGDNVLDPSEDRDGDGVLDLGEDADGDGKLDRREPGIQGVTIFVDVNKDGRLSVLEPAAQTNFFGQYTISNLPSGTDYIVRELVFPTGTQTLPGSLGLPALPAIGAVPFAYTSVTVRPNQTTFGLDFGNTVAEDFGDAPASYGNPKHGMVPSFGLGLLKDAEPGAIPTANALGDDLNGADDEDGVVVAGLTPGATSTIFVTVDSGAFPVGKLHGWIDFDQDGVFEASERIVANRMLGTGTHSISVTVPATAKLNETFARFRYGYEIDLGPSGSSAVGEVEDHQVTILPSRPVAVNDEFGNPPNLIRQGTTDNPLDVLANDIRTARGLPQIVESEFPKTTSQGGTVRVGPVDPATGRKVLLYTPPSILVEEAPFDDTFTYNVTDGVSTSIVPGVVTIHVSLGNPVAFDDTFTVDPAVNTEASTGDTIITLAVMENDRFPLLDSRVSTVNNLTANPMGATATINASDPQRIDFRAPSGFRGTAVFQYTISDNDPGTLDSTAITTVQVVDGGLAATDDQLLTAGYLAELSVQLLDGSGMPTSLLMVDVGETFQVVITADDLRLGGDFFNRGVESAYLDVLVPLFTDALGNKFPFADLVPNSIVYQPPPPDTATYRVAQQGFFNSPAPGSLSEAGGTHNSSTTGEGTGPDPVDVFTVTLRARASTVGQAIQILADPPEGLPGNSEASDITVMPDVPGGGSLADIVFHLFNEPPANPQVLQAFFRPSGDLIILGSGEGAFVNRENPLDVDMDSSISPGDALAVINYLNAFGAQSLMGDCDLPTVNMVDTNMDWNLTAADALGVINYLNSRSHRSIISSMTAGGEGEVASTSGGMETSSDIDAGLTTIEEPSTTTTSTTSTQVDATAADDLYAQMAAAEQELRNRFRRR